MTRDQVAREQLPGADVGEQPPELERVLGLGELSDEAGANAAAELRGVGDEQLVEQPLLHQLAVQPRAALAQQGADAALGPQVPEQR